MEVVLDLGLQPLSSLDFQILDESLEPETKFESVEYNSVPLVFNSFQILKETLEKMLMDKYIQSQEISFESTQQSCQSLQNPIVNLLDDLCCQDHVSCANYGLEIIYDIDMVRQSFSWFDSTTTSSQSSLENLQTNQNLHNDTDGICVLSGDALKIDKFEYQEIGYVYHDPIAV